MAAPWSSEGLSKLLLHWRPFAFWYILWIHVSSQVIMRLRNSFFFFLNTAWQETDRHQFDVACVPRSVALWPIWGIPGKISDAMDHCLNRFKTKAQFLSYFTSHNSSMSNNVRLRLPDVLIRYCRSRRFNTNVIISRLTTTMNTGAPFKHCWMRQHFTLKLYRQSKINVSTFYALSLIHIWRCRRRG